jgi:hypothetical protein
MPLLRRLKNKLPNHVAPLENDGWCGAGFEVKSIFFAIFDHIMGTNYQVVGGKTWSESCILTDSIFSRVEREESLA